MADFSIWCREPDYGRQVTAYESCVAVALPSQTYLRWLPPVPSGGPHDLIITLGSVVLNALVAQIERAPTPVER
jgi:hypothetical protein